MVCLEKTAEIHGMEDLLADLEVNQEKPWDNSFLETNDEGLMDNCEYHKMQFDRYGYVANLIDDFF